MTARLEQASDERSVLPEARAAARFVTDVAIDIATWAYRTAGGSALKLDNPLQRVLRDLLAAGQHAYVDDASQVAHGADVLGAGQ